MIFRRLILTALAIGLLSGLLLSALQISLVNPIIFAAETFEIIEVEHGDHSHDDEAWAPEDGSERTFYTVSSNIFAAIGFAAVLLSLISQLQLQRRGLPVAMPRQLQQGALWGLGGFIALFVAPAIGLPPEIPSIEAAPVEMRQQWWLLAVVAVAGGLLTLVFAPLKLKVLGLAALALPYLVTIPHADGPAFLHPDPAAVAALNELHQQFITTSAATSLVFWLLLGCLAMVAAQRFIAPAYAPAQEAHG